MADYVAIENTEHGMTGNSRESLIEVIMMLSEQGKMAFYLAETGDEKTLYTHIEYALHEKLGDAVVRSLRPAEYWNVTHQTLGFDAYTAFGQSIMLNLDYTVRHVNPNGYERGLAIAWLAWKLFSSKEQRDTLGTIARSTIDRIEQYISANNIALLEI